MNKGRHQARDLKTIDLDLLEDMARRVTDIDNCYRAVAEKVGQLYMKADEENLNDITTQLDKPMRNASENEQVFAALLGEIRMQCNSRR